MPLKKKRRCDKKDFIIEIYNEEEEAKNDDTLGNIESVRHMRLKAHRPPTDQKSKTHRMCYMTHRRLCKLK